MAAAADFAATDEWISWARRYRGEFARSIKFDAKIAVFDIGADRFVAGRDGTGFYLTSCEQREFRRLFFTSGC